MSDEQNNKDKRDLLLNTLASVREKLDKVKVDYDSLQRVQGAYRSIFNKGEDIYDGLHERLDEGQAKKQLERDILTKNCGIEYLDKFLDSMDSCWLDFFGSDSFSDSKEKKQIFFATLCKDDKASKNREKHVDAYRKLNKTMPVDIFIQLFFASKEELKQLDNLSRITKEGFVIKLKSGVKQEEKPNYSKEIKKINKEIKKKKDLCTKEKLFQSLEESLSSNVSKASGLLCLDYKKQFESCAPLTIEARFLKGVCDINWSLHTKVKYVYFLPIPCPDGSNGLICFGSRKKIDKTSISLLNALAFNILYPFTSSYKTVWQQIRLKKESIKSAIAAIMSRNMSHNLGSHFISNTKNYFNALIDRYPDNKKNYRGIKYALQYIQERMDFIATITSTDFYPYGAVNAKAQVFDELTPDDFGKRHGQESYNFLMDYLVLSEKISKQSWGGDGAVLSAGEHQLMLQIGYWDGKEEPVYWDPTQKGVEDNKKRDEILGINFAIPGGILGRHAVFSIVENIIRNAAKHGGNKIQDKFVVKLLYRIDEKRLVIFDNKKDSNIKGTVKIMKDRLKKMHFLNSEGILEQENKGLKEMLICAVWLQNENVAQVMTDNDSKNERDRLKCFENYLKVVAVDKDGKEFVPDKNSVGHLGYSIKLDQYEKVHYINEKNELSSKGLKSIKADIVCYKDDCEIGKKKLSEIFARFLKISEDGIGKIGEADVLKLIVEKNCGSEAVQRKMVVSYTTEYEDGSVVIPYSKWSSNGDAFLFKGHAGKSKWDKFSSLFLTKGFENKYVDAISGGDFTYTLVQPSFVNDEYNLLKIKESVATRFVIVDERVFEHYRSDMEAEFRKKLINGVRKKQSRHTCNKEIAEYIFEDYEVLGDSFDVSQIEQEFESEFQAFVSDKKKVNEFLKKDIEQHYQERRGIYIFNLGGIENDEFCLEDLSYNIVNAEEDSFKWKGNDFCINFDNTHGLYDYGNARSDSNAMTFLSIHLGIIDKIREQMGLGDNDDNKIVEALKKFFRANFVSIHSGRGGFDIRESLKQYAFQSFSTIENPLYNSKYLLAQQFYNINYYGSKE